MASMYIYRLDVGANVGIRIPCWDYDNAMSECRRHVLSDPSQNSATLMRQVEGKLVTVAELRYDMGCLTTREFLDTGQVPTPSQGG